MEKNTNEKKQNSNTFDKDMKMDESMKTQDANSKEDEYVEVDASENTEENVEEMSREEELEQEVRQLKDDYLRLKADFENYRKRMQEDMQKARERAISNFVEDLLPNIDNFEMSLKMTNDTTMFIKGVEMIHQNLLNVLQNHSISVYEPQIGQEFNVKEHEPILVEHEEHPPGTITNVLTKGYKMKDSIIRPARVQVVKFRDDAVEQSDAQEEDSDDMADKDKEEDEE
ncbi:MAG: nucleotide exchange factor GrpE [Candidatus Nanoarchaeia archaeon]